MILVFGKDDVPIKTIDRAKASGVQVQPLSDEVWHQHFAWVWTVGLDPANFVIEESVREGIANQLAVLRATYPRIHLVMLGAAAYEKWFSYVMASALLHERLEEDGKVHVKCEDLEYVSRAFEEYLDDLGVSEAEQYYTVQEQTLHQFEVELTENQRRAILLLAEASYSRPALGELLGIAETSVSRMMHQASEYDPDTGQHRFFGVNMMTGQLALIQLQRGKYVLTVWGRKMARMLSPQQKLAPANVDDLKLVKLVRNAYRPGQEFTQQDLVTAVQLDPELGLSPDEVARWLASRLGKGGLSRSGDKFSVSAGSKLDRSVMLEEEGG